MLAAYAGSEKVAALLLEFGADPRAATVRGDTALHYAAMSLGSSSEGKAAVARLLCGRGADPEARDAGGHTPLTAGGGCGYNDVAAALIAAGAAPTLNHALRAGMTDWVRRELRANPEAVRECPEPRRVIDDIGNLIAETAARRHGRALRLARGEAPAEGEDEWADWNAVRAETGYRHKRGVLLARAMIRARRHFAETQREVFCELRDLLDLAVERGADPAGVSALFYAAQMYDTSLAEWLLAHGVDPNPQRKPGGSGTYYTDLAVTRRMLDLLHRYGAEDDPYTRETTPGERRARRQRDRLRDAFT